MCICYCLHHHHQPPCRRPLDLVAQCAYCPAAPLDPSTRQPVAPCGQVRYEPAPALSGPDPCAAGGCLVSPDCSSGVCRLNDLGGLWTCCRCWRGGNMMRWCQHKKKGSPDTFCYHTVCRHCTSEVL